MATLTEVHGEAAQKARMAGRRRGRSATARSAARRAAAAVIIGLLAGGVIGYALWQQTAPPAGAAVIRIAIQPTATPGAITAQASDLERFLEARAGPGVAVEISIPTDYTATIQAIEYGHADVALMSAWPASLAAERAGAEIVLAERRAVVIGNESRVEPYYHSSYIVPAGSAAVTLNDTKGGTVCYPSRVSTSGYLFPVARLVETGRIPRPGPQEQADPARFFGTVIFGGGYQQCWEALKAGQVDVAVIAGDVPETLYRQVLNATRVLETQGPIPSHTVVFAKGLREPLRSKLRQAFLDLGAEEHRPLMRKLVSSIFVEFQVTTTEAHVAGLSRAVELTNFGFS